MTRHVELRLEPWTIVVALVSVALVGMVLSSWLGTAGASDASKAPWASTTQAGVTLYYKPIDQAEIPAIAGYVDRALQTIEAFFEMPLPDPLDFYLFPDRNTLTEHWKKQWGVPFFISMCWMVGSGSAANFSLLSPRAWEQQACDHDPADSDHVQKLITHEMVHSYHDQVHPSADIGVFEDIGWFIEGVAVFVSGQLEGDRLASPREAIEKGEAPKALKNAWSGTYRYGVSGSLVAYIDQTYGRQTTIALLSQSSQDELLDIIGETEAELLEHWQQFILNGGIEPLEKRG